MIPVMVEKPEDFDAIPNGTILVTATGYPAWFKLYFPPIFNPHQTEGTKIVKIMEQSDSSPEETAIRHYPMQVIWIPDGN